ncbi:MAG: hypothetical protein K2P93_09160 [Alphaproteobacteria bacterium]|nr:hypothetical protein [Alphaproteobacteria bacterium]
MSFSLTKSQSINSLSGTGGTVSLNENTLTINGSGSFVFAGQITSQIPDNK